MKAARRQREIEHGIRRSNMGSPSPVGIAMKVVAHQASSPDRRMLGRNDTSQEQCISE